MAETQVEVEYLDGQEIPADAEVTLAPLAITTPLEHFKNLFDRMAQLRDQVVLWEKKTVITNAPTRDQAIQLRTVVTRTAKLIEEARLKLVEPVQKYLKEVKGYSDQAQEALVGTKDNPMLGVAGRLTQKISDHAAACKRLEEEMKAKALAEQKRVEAEIQARQEEAFAKEQALRLEEQHRLDAIEASRLAAEQAEGHNETDQMAADLARGEEQARIDADRAQREKAQRDQEIADQKAADAAQQKTVNTMAVATAMGKVKGVKEIWVIELVDETLLDKKFMAFDPAKARKWLDGGFHDAKEKDANKIIPGLRCVLALGKGGR